jgi:NAD(P)-dependent dehydrogenase (short-subunit alcohol dehydrogenase family)
VSQQDPHTEARTAARDARIEARDEATAAGTEPPAGSRTAPRTRIALVTGGNRGLGRSTVLRLAADGVDTILTYRSHADEARAVVAEAAVLGRTAHAVALDTGRIEDFAGFADGVRRLLKENWGRDDLDILVNNAGQSAGGSILETTVEDFDALVNVHFRGVYFLTQALIPLLADGGRIVNVSTGLTRFTGEGRAAYASVKGAVEVFTRYLAKELGPRGITANTLAPGPVVTDFGGGTIRNNPHLRDLLGAQAALGRVGEPEDIGPAIAALVGEGTGWITGQRVEASGGLLL